MKRLTFAFAAIATLATGVMTTSTLRGVSSQDQPPDGVKIVATWVYPPISLAQMVSNADVIAVLTTTSTRPGRSVGSSAVGAPPLEFELVDFAVAEVLKGVPAGTITVERVGSTQRGGRVIVNNDGGAFAAGTRHLLFLKKQSDAPYYVLLNDQGRYAVRQDRLEAVTQGTVSAAMDGKSVLEAVAVISQGSPRR